MFAAFKDLSVKTKVTGAFALVMVAMIALGLFSIQRLSQVNNNAVEVRDNWLPGTRLLGEIKYLAMRYRQRQAVYLMITTDAERAKERAYLDSIKAEFESEYKAYAPTIDSEQERALAATFMSKWRDYLALEQGMFDDLKTKGQATATEEYKTTIKDAFDGVRNGITADSKYNNDGGMAAANKGDETFRAARLFIFIALGIAVALCFACGWLLIRSVSKPLSRMTTAMGDLAAGNLETHVPHADQTDEVGQLAEAMTSFKNQLAAAERSKAEQTKTIVSSIGEGLDHLAKGNLTHRVMAELIGPFAKLKEDFNAAMGRLENTMQDVLTSTSHIASGANEVSQAADDLSRRTEQQAASLEETAAALEEITATVKTTAGNSKQAAASVAEAKRAAEDGANVVETAVSAMDAISQSSKQITDIIGVIDEIAFQTNLLALNAGVEAARAGEAGRGFAVVASEVRALAQRSSEAAKQIKALIKTSGEHVGTGVKLVGDSGQALRHIFDQVLNINELVTEMTRATEQQSVGLEQVNTAVSQMDQVTQQNAAMVEESTAASRTLASETHNLTETIGFFTVGHIELEPAAARVISISHHTPTAMTKRAVAKPRIQATPAHRGSDRFRSTSAASANVQLAKETEDWAEF